MGVISLSSKCIFIFLLFWGFEKSNAAPKISPFLQSILRDNLQSELKFNLTLSMTQSRNPTVVTSHLFSEAKVLNSYSRKQMAPSVVEALKNEADTVQNDLLFFLSEQTKSNSYSKFHQLWITNQIIVYNANRMLLQSLSLRDDLSAIEEEKLIKMIDPIDAQMSRRQNINDDTIQWGVSQIGADRIWTMGIRGRNVVVGAIDTGVRGTHEALNSNFRQDHGWFDAVGSSLVPFDPHGHGTHSLGSIVGTTMGIGVAPEATWIACRALDQNNAGSAISLLRCMQWIACPSNPDGTNPNCRMAPDLVSNSWGSSTTTNAFEVAIEVWQLLGIIPIFSIGNDGFCETTWSPANYENVIGVGSVTIDGKVSDYSSGGPILFHNSTLIKPDVSAPGSDIFSAHNRNDADYVLMSGTSMACPHVSGLVALLLNWKPHLTYDDIKYALEKGAVPMIYTTGRNCGGIDESTYPNNVVGWGRIDAVKTFYALQPEVTSTDSSVSPSTFKPKETYIVVPIVSIGIALALFMN